MRFENNHHTIEDVKEQVINTSLVVSSVLGTAAYLFSNLSRYFNNSFNISLLFESLVLLPLIIITIRRDHLRNSTKAYIMIALLFFLSLSDALIYGLLSSTRIYLVLVPLFAIVYFPFIRSIVIYVIALLGFGTIGYFHSKGILNIPAGYEPEIYIFNFYPWIINAIHISAVGLIILFVTRKFFLAYNRFIDHLQDQNKIISDSERNYREIFNSTNEAIFIHDASDGKIFDVNDVMLNMYGIGSKEEALKLSIQDISANDDRSTEHKARMLIRKATEEGPQVFEWQSRKLSGDLFYSEISLRGTEIGGKGRVLAVVRDVTERKKAEQELERYKNHLEFLVKERTEELEATNEELTEANDELMSQREELEAILNKLQKTQKQLIQSEKMASIGILAAGIAHELNNPLNFIKGGVDAIESHVTENFENDTDIKRLVEIVNEGVIRASKIVSSLNHYSRRNDKAFADSDLHKVIDNCLLILKNQINDAIQVRKLFTNQPFILFCNEGKIHQAILNLLSNAVQAIDSQGEIVIETLSRADELHIFIKDSGAGISSENISKIMDPFFTTKDPGKGTGLGLFITHDIVEEHSGSLLFDSEPGKGTRVHLVFPRSQRH